MPRPLALVVDRDAGLRARLQEFLKALGAEALGAVSAEDARSVVRRRDVDLFFAAPGELIAASAGLRGHPLSIAIFPDAQEKLITGPTWLEHGADDLLDLGAEDASVLLTLRRCLAWAAQRGRQSVLQNAAQEKEGFGGLVGRSSALEMIRERLNRLAPLDETIWIEGENGVGKKWCAQTLHDLRKEPETPFVVVEAIDLETNGWEDRWLDPDSARARVASTLYLSDPCGFSERGIERLQRLASRIAEAPGQGPRMISGSTLSISVAIEEGRIPATLAQQLGAARLHLPPLRDRPEDIGPMAQHFIRTIAGINQLEPHRLSAAALDQLEAYAWPGNVRELRHAIEHAAILADELIDLPQLPRTVRDSAQAASLGSRASLATVQFREAKGEVVAAFEKQYLGSLMERARGNVTAAARESGMLRSALQRLLRKYDLKSADYRKSSPARGGLSTGVPRVG